METVSIKLDGELARKMEKEMAKAHYSTKTEFIRDAIRSKLKELEREKAWGALLAARGSLKGKGRFKTDEEFYEWRKNEGSRELMEYLEKKYPSEK